jgi:outer membrane protein OmpA-like peptidoglycan-associated protein
MRKNATLVTVVILVVLVASPLVAAERFSDELQQRFGTVRVGAVTSTDEVQVPYILWGGDFATFYANGGVTTKPGSIFDRHGLNIRLVPGDDAYAQARDYISGKSPFFRGTFGMGAMASEVLNQNSSTQAEVLFQMTWSMGDHMVCRPNIKTIGDLGSAKVVLQQGGPHVKFYRELLIDSRISWADHNIVWAKDLFGSPDSPAEKFKRDSSIDCAFVVTPDMIALSGGLQNVGTGAEGTVKGARVVVSTAERTRSIADVYFVRGDFAKQNPGWVEKFALGYLQAVEKITDLKKQYESSGSAEMRKLLQMAIRIYGTGAIPNEDEAYGLLIDCAFVGHPGNVQFFTKAKNLVGFEAFNTAGMQFATRRGYAAVQKPFAPSHFDWNAPAFMNNLEKTEAVRRERFQTKKVQAEIESFTELGQLDERTIYSFTIHFEPNQTEFSASQYGADFDEVIRLATQYPNAVVAVRGHSDPTATLRDFVRAGMERGILQRTGSRSAGYTYSLDSRPLDLQGTPQLIELVRSGRFDGATAGNPRETMQAAMNLSYQRSNSVRAELITYASQQGLQIDKSQITPQGVGIREPFITKPANMEQARQNMRVEFRLIRVSAEVTGEAADFDF